MIRSWGFVDSSDVLMIRSLDLLIHLTSWWSDILGSSKFRANSCDYWTTWRIRLEDPIFRVICPEICEFLLDHLEDPLFRIPLKSLSDVVHVVHRPILPDQFLFRRSSRDSLSDSYISLFLVDHVDQYITWFSNINVHYDCSVVVIKYVRKVLRVLWV